jgi:hypothetical protein
VLLIRCWSNPFKAGKNTPLIIDDYISNLKMRRCDVKFSYYVDSTKTKIEKLENKNSIYTSQNIYPLHYIINQDYKTSYHNRFHNLNSQEKERKK